MKNKDNYEKIRGILLKQLEKANLKEEDEIFEAALLLKKLYEDYQKAIIEIEEYKQLVK